MITNYPMNPAARRLGETYGPRLSVDLNLAELPQISTFTFADGSPAASETWTLTITDDETGQAYAVAVTSAASVADSIEAVVDAIAADGKANDLLTAVEDGSTVVTVTARHVGRSYSFAWAFSGGSSASATVATTQLAGGAKVPFGVVLAKSSENEARLLSATDTLAMLAGVVRRTDANHTRPFEPADARSGFDGRSRGRTLSLAHDCRIAVEPEVAPSALTDSVFVRRAQTSSVGTVGAFRASAAGGQQLYTFTPAAINLPGYGFQFEFRGVPYTALYLGDGSTTVAQACDGLVQDLGAIAGLTITDAATAMTIQTPAGERLENVRNLASHTDVPADSVTIAETTGADIDTIDLSSVARWESLPDAQGLCVLRLRLL